MEPINWGKISTPKISGPLIFTEPTSNHWLTCCKRLTGPTSFSCARSRSSQYCLQTLNFRFVHPVFPQGSTLWVSKTLNSNFSDFRTCVLDLTSTLTQTFTREIENHAIKLQAASDETDKLKTSLAAAEELLANLTQERRESSSLLPEVTVTEVPGNIDVEFPFVKCENKPFSDLEYASLRDSTEQYTSFTNRRVAYYGDEPYRYSGGYHRARPMTENQALTDLANRVRSLYPDITFNSATITDYPDTNSFIPPTRMTNYVSNRTVQYWQYL